MRDNVRAFVEIAARTLGLRGPVYEFGAYQVAGQEEISDLRPCFPGRKYVGCDLRAGPGVDRVEDLGKLSLPDGCALSVVCVDTLEHVFEARRAVDEMLRVLAPGGVILLSAPMEFRIHDYPGDYWRLTPSCVDRLLERLPARLVGSQGQEIFPHTVYGIAAKPPLPPDFAAGLNRFLAEFQAWLAAAERQRPWRQRFRERLLAPLRSKGERRRQRGFYEARFVLDLPLSAATLGETVAAPRTATLEPAPLLRELHQP